MNTVIVTERTKEVEPPAAVKLMKFVIDKKHYLMANSYGSIDLCSEQSYGIVSRVSLEDARHFHAALTALLTAWDGKPPTGTATVVDCQRESDLREADRIIKKAEELLPRLRQAVAG